MEELLKFLEDEGFEFEVGCREKERKKIWVKQWKNEKRVMMRKRLN